MKRKVYTCKLGEQQCLEECHDNEKLMEKCSACTVTEEEINPKILCEDACDWPDCTKDRCVANPKLYTQQEIDEAMIDLLKFVTNTGTLTFGHKWPGGYQRLLKDYRKHSLKQEKK